MRYMPLALLMLALPMGGCSFSSQLEGLFSKSDETGSTKPAQAAAAPVVPADSDLEYAKAAAREVLARGDKDASAPWSNPRTGARGTVTPLATSYVQAGLTCRDFLASYVKDGAESWMQGEACRMHRGKWEVKNLKPWKRS